MTRSQRHGGNDGEAHFALKRGSGGTTLWRDEYVGEGICLGFNQRAGRHVVAIKKEHGIGVRVMDVRYVEAKSPHSRPSAFDRRKLEAFAMVASSDLHYVAFIVMHGNDSALFVLDVERNTLQKLGAAPKPPPLSAKERQLLHDVGDELEGPWDWMASLRDGYMRLDDGIIGFPAPGFVRVSYGDDGPDGRAAKRTLVTWDLRGKQARRVSERR